MASLRLSRVFCVVLAAGLLAGGCGTTSDETAAVAKQPLKGGHARLKIYRTNELMAGVPAARVKVDDREVAQLGVGGSIMVDVPAGTRQVVVDAFGAINAHTFGVNASAGKLYVLEISPRAEPVVAGIMLGLVGQIVEAASNPNGGTFQVRLVETKAARG
jgi:hypothetical protein